MTVHARSRPAIDAFTRLPIRTWMEVAAERRHLRNLTARELRDIGLSPEEAYREARRPFWDLPSGR